MRIILQYNWSRKNILTLLLNNCITKVRLDNAAFVDVKLGNVGVRIPTRAMSKGEWTLSRLRLGCIFGDDHQIGGAQLAVDQVLPAKREVLSGLSRNEEISDFFFLTGGTALADFRRVFTNLAEWIYDQGR